MRLSEIRKICPDVIILPSDYETYSLYSERMYEIVRRYTEAIEEYSIDECFADLTGMRRPNRMSYEDMAIRIQRELSTELGMTFSVGLSVNKTLAKVASKWRKPDGLTIIAEKAIPHYLSKLPVGKVWGIGPNTASYIEKLIGARSERKELGGRGEFPAGNSPNPRRFSAENRLRTSSQLFSFAPRDTITALDFAGRSDEWVREHFSKPFQEIHRELNGDFIYPLTIGQKHDYASISKTRTFTPPSRDKEYIFSQLSKNIENACIKLRRHDLFTKRLAFFLKTQGFHYHGLEIKLSHRVSIPQEILSAIREKFDMVYRPGVEYRATGIVLMDLDHSGAETFDLFGNTSRLENSHKVLRAMDGIDRRYGKHTVFLGSSWKAMNEPAHKGDRGESSERRKKLFKGETARRRLGLPFIGNVF